MGVRRGLVWMVLVSAVACRPELTDEANLCIEPFGDRIVAEVSVACASDHQRAELSCEVVVDGTEATVMSTYREGKDPNDACAEPLVATCRSDVLDAGTYTISYAGERYDIELPLSERTCGPAGGTG